MQLAQQAASNANARAAAASRLTTGGSWWKSPAARRGAQQAALCKPQAPFLFDPAPGWQAARVAMHERPSNDWANAWRRALFSSLMAHAVNIKG